MSKRVSTAYVRDATGPSVMPVDPTPGTLYHAKVEHQQTLQQNGIVQAFAPSTRSSGRVVRPSHAYNATAIYQLEVTPGTTCSRPSPCAVRVHHDGSRPCMHGTRKILPGYCLPTRPSVFLMKMGRMHQQQPARMQPRSATACSTQGEWRKKVQLPKKL